MNEIRESLFSHDTNLAKYKYLLQYNAPFRVPVLLYAMTAELLWQLQKSDWIGLV